MQQELLEETACDNKQLRCLLQIIRNEIKISLFVIQNHEPAASDFAFDLSSCDGTQKNNEIIIEDGHQKRQQQQINVRYCTTT